MLRIEVPRNQLPEHKYIVEVLFEEFLGLSYSLTTGPRDEVTVSSAEIADQRSIVLPSILLAAPTEHWLKVPSLPRRPLDRWLVRQHLPEVPLVEPKLPVIYGERLANGSWFEQEEGSIRIGLDVLGSAFFMLTRYEELIHGDRDQHERYTAAASLALQEGFLERPIVNEYLEILWACIRRLWPQLRRKSSTYRLVLSHDVDSPFASNDSNAWQTVKGAGEDVIRRKDSGLALRRTFSYLQSRLGNYTNDVHNNFERLMDTSENFGIASAFYFICGNSAGAIDGNYKLHDPAIRDIIKRIHQRGHEIGLHPTYNSFRDEHQIRTEFNTLQEATMALGITQSRWGGRQHFLRWEAPTTWQLWSDAGLSYDSSVGYADHAGFRAGVCYEYPVFNLLTREVLTLRERPLVVMEATLLREQYMNLNLHEAIERATNLAGACRQFAGEFTLLWHNSQLLTVNDWSLYLDVLNGVAA